jgi:hypothetical protein
MEKTRKNRRTEGFYILCASTGAFIAFLTPEITAQPIEHAGLIASIIAFEIKYSDLLLLICAGGLIYRLVIKKAQGREAMIMLAGLGFVVVRLLLSLRHIIS